MSKPKSGRIEGGQPPLHETRRRFLQVGAGVGGALALGAVDLPAAQAQQRHASHAKHRTSKQAFTAAGALKKFVDKLPVPQLATPVGTLAGVRLYDINMVQFRQQLHRDLPPTTLWGYNGMFPGPTFEVRRGRPIAVKWRNSLPAKHFLPIDHTIHGADPALPEVRSVVHLHGMKTLPESDGLPDAWFTRGFAQTGPDFAGPVYHYPNDQQATALWYHDHAIGITRLNIYAGLGGGLYLIRDDNEDQLGLPRGEYEMPLVIHDRFFNPDGSLLYPVVTPGDPDPRVPPLWIPEFFGDTVLVNGKIWPHLEVKARKYRFRVLNASNARFYRLTLEECTARGKRLGRPGPPFYQIGSDGGFLPAPVRRTDLLMAPSERFDVVIDFAGWEGRCFVLANDAPAPFPDGEDIVPPDVMLFKVDDDRQVSRLLPARLNDIPLLDPLAAVTVRDLVLSELDSAAGSPIMAMINDAHWDDPITESPQAGTTEVWRIINTTGDAHPIHIHLVEFQVLDRQPFDPDQFPTLVFTGPKEPPQDNERPAWKDTVLSYPGQVVRVIMRFDLPTGTPIRPGQKFKYVFHCHILEHEENEMMRPYEVVG